MKITFEETNSRKDWIHKELLQSLDGDIISAACKEGAYDVHLLVNGSKLEPKFFNSLVDDIESYVKAEARTMIEDKLHEVDMKVRKLDELIREASENIMDEVGLRIDG